MKTLKDKKNQHRCDNPANAHWGTKEERKKRRKAIKAFRHKVKMHIPLSEDEAARWLTLKDFGFEEEM